MSPNSIVERARLLARKRNRDAWVAGDLGRRRRTLYHRKLTEREEWERYWRADMRREREVVVLRRRERMRIKSRERRERELRAILETERENEESEERDVRPLADAESPRAPPSPAAGDETRRCELTADRGTGTSSG